MKRYKFLCTVFRIVYLFSIITLIAVSAEGRSLGLIITQPESQAVVLGEWTGTMAK